MEQNGWFRLESERQTQIERKRPEATPATNASKRMDMSPAITQTTAAPEMPAPERELWLERPEKKDMHTDTATEQSREGQNMQAADIAQPNLSDQMSAASGVSQRSKTVPATASNLCRPIIDPRMANDGRMQAEVSHSSFTQQAPAAEWMPKHTQQHTDVIAPEQIKENKETASCQEDPYQDKLHNPHAQTVGPDGLVVLQDTMLHETLETFVHQKIIERAVHVKGFGAFGWFTCYQPMSEYTRLPFLQASGQKTPTMSRFSLAVSNKGTPDTSRNVRGFSTKFYTEEGIFDLLCNHIPVFLVRDAIRFPEAIQALSPSPQSNLIEPNRFWDFVARTPESIHFITWLYSDVGTAKSFLHLRPSSVNTYVWINRENRRRYVKYHWLPVAGEEYIDAVQAMQLAGSNPDIAGQELWDTIAAGRPVEYELAVQLMEPETAQSLAFDPLDDTKIWDEKAFPLLKVGMLSLNKNPDDYTAQIEKAAFSPANLLPGAELSDDKMLQGRSFIYWDAQRRRLGPDFRSNSVNRQADWTPNREITSGNGRVTEGKLTRSDITRPDNFTQAGEHYQSLDETAKAHLIANIAGELYAVPLSTRSTVMNYFRQASSDLADRLAHAFDKNSK